MILFLQWPSLAKNDSGQDLIVIGGKGRTGFEKQSCSWMAKQYFLNQNKELAEFKRSGGELDCSREAVLARERAKIKDAPGTVARFSSETLLKLNIRDKVLACWDKKDAYHKREAELLDQLLAAMRIRINLYDAKNILATDEGKRLLGKQCKIIPRMAYKRDSQVPQTFLGYRFDVNQSDEEFIRDHSVSCDVINRVGVETSAFQESLRKQFPGYKPGTRVIDSLGGYDVANKIKSLYSSSNDFEERQICQQMINKQNDENEANRILPKVEKGVDVAKTEKPDECRQFENTFDCNRFEGKEIKVMIGWPICMREVLSDCQAKLDTEGRSGGKPATAHGERANQ